MFDKFINDMAYQPAVRNAFLQDADAVLEKYGLSEFEKKLVRSGNSAAIEHYLHSETRKEIEAANQTTEMHAASNVIVVNAVVIVAAPQGDLSAMQDDDDYWQEVVEGAERSSR